MSTRHELAAEFAEVAQRLQSEQGRDLTLAEVLRAAIDAVGADVGGVMLVQRRKVRSAAVSADIVLRADELQLETGDGPCLEAIEEHDTFVISDTETEDRWPQWCSRVDDLGIRSVLSVRLRTFGGTLGSLNLYAYEPQRFSKEDAVVGTILASHASVALAAEKERSELREAIDGRHMIGMAQGILMERFQLEESQAFAVLRRYSQDRNIKLREVASQVVGTRSLPN